MLFALIAGAGTAITPCVLPVLPALLSASAPGAAGGRSGSCSGWRSRSRSRSSPSPQLVKGVGLASGAARTLAIVVLIAFGVSC